MPPIYPINVFWRFVPCVYILGGAMVWNSYFVTSLCLLSPSSSLMSLTLCLLLPSFETLLRTFQTHVGKAWSLRKVVTSHTGWSLRSSLNLQRPHEFLIKLSSIRTKLRFPPRFHPVRLPLPLKKNKTKNAKQQTATV